MGKSLGIDPISHRDKVCNLDCVYCQLGKAHGLTEERKAYVPTNIIIHEISQFFEWVGFENPLMIENIDYLTFSGRGEPTLAKNLGDMILSIRQIREEKIAVITNSTLLHLPEVRNDLSLSDLVVAKLDAYDERSFSLVDKPMTGSSFKKVIEGLKTFRRQYHGRLAIQVMFIKENVASAPKLASLIRDIGADEVQLNTPLRFCSVLPLNFNELSQIKEYFLDLPAVTVYERERKPIMPFSSKTTKLRHGCVRKLPFC